MRRKTLRLLSITVLLVFMASLIACGSASNTGTSESTSQTETVSNEKTSAATEDTKKEPVTLTAATFNGWKTDALQTGLKMVEEKTGIKVDLSLYPDDQFQNVFKTKLATGDVPDMFFHNFAASFFAATELEVLDGPWASRILDATKSATIREDGSIIKAPFGGLGNMGFLYNKQVMQKAGVQLPLKNYNDLLAACEAIKKVGVTPIYLPNKEVWTAQILFLSTQTSIFDGKQDVIDNFKGNKLKPQDMPDLVKLWENAYALKEKGYMNEDCMSATIQMAEQAIAEGKAGFLAGGDWLYADYLKSFPDQLKDVGMTVIPLTDSEPFVMTNVSNKYVSVTANAKNKDKAKEFVNAFVSDECMKAMYEFEPAIPPYKDMDCKMNAWNGELNDLSKTFKAMGDYSNYTFKGEFWGDFNLHAQNLFAGKPAKQCLTEWYNKYAADAKAKKLAGF